MKAGFYPSPFVYQRFRFFTVCLVHYLREDMSALGEHRRENFWNLGLQIAGKYISDILSDCKTMACSSLINTWRD